jgi:hypothetical protein
MQFRNYQPGDAAVQVEIYNAAAAALPRFKPAKVEDVEHRVAASDFDPGQRLFAVVHGKVVGYCLVNANGRISYPWCLPGFEQVQDPLFSKVMEEAEIRGLTKTFTAYRGDWPIVHDFFLKKGFRRARDIVNFYVPFGDMPTPSETGAGAMTPLTPADVPALFGFLPQALRVSRPELLSEHLFDNPYFSSDALFAMRSRGGELMAAGVAVYDPAYADPCAVDANMPCYRLGAFGTEGMQAKRLKGVFSFLARPNSSLPALALDLMGRAAGRLRDRADVAGLAAQAASDVPAVLAFYEHYFTKQGSFPVFEKTIKG